MFANGGRRVNADADRPHPGPLRPHHLQARPARMPRLRRQELGQSARADADRPPRAGARSDDRLPDHLDHGRRRPARHRDRRRARSASRSPARPAPPTTRRTPGSSASRPISWSASIMGYDKPRHLARLRHRRPSRRADRQGLLQGGARRQAGDAVPRAARHQAHPGRCQDRPARRPGRLRSVILEAFKPGTAPPDSYSVIGRDTADAGVAGSPRFRPTPAAPFAAGTGGLVLTASDVAMQSASIAGAVCICAARTLRSRQRARI